VNTEERTPEGRIAALEQLVSTLRQDNVRQWQAILRLARLVAKITGVPEQDIAAEEALMDEQLRRAGS